MGTEQARGDTAQKGRHRGRARGGGRVTSVPSKPRRDSGGFGGGLACVWGQAQSSRFFLASIHLQKLEGGIPEAGEGRAYPRL